MNNLRIMITIDLPVKSITEVIKNKNFGSNGFLYYVNVIDRKQCERMHFKSKKGNLIQTLIYPINVHEIIDYKGYLNEYDFNDEEEDNEE